MKRIALGTLILCPALLSAQPAEFPAMSSLLSSPNSAQMTSGSIPGALCPYVMVDAGAIQEHQPFDVFSYVNGVLMTGLRPPAEYRTRGAIAAPLSMVNEIESVKTTGSGIIGTAIPLDGTNIIAFEVTLTGLNDMADESSLISYFMFGTSRVLDFENNQQKDAGIMISVSRYSQRSTSNIDIVSMYEDTTNQLSSRFFGEMPQTHTENSVTLGLYYDQKTRRVGFVTEAFGDYGYIPTTDQGSIIGIQPFQEMGTSSGLFHSRTGVIGPASQSDPMVITTYKTNANDFTLTYPAGAVDICGNEI